MAWIVLALDFIKLSGFTWGCVYIVLRLTSRNSCPSLRSDDLKSRILHWLKILDIKRLKESLFLAAEPINTGLVMLRVSASLSEMMFISDSEHSEEKHLILSVISWILNRYCATTTLAVGSITIQCCTRRIKVFHLIAELDNAVKSNLLEFAQWWLERCISLFLVPIGDCDNVFQPWWHCNKALCDYTYSLVTERSWLDSLISSHSTLQQEDNQSRCSIVRLCKKVLGLSCPGVFLCGVCMFSLCLCESEWLPASTCGPVIRGLSRRKWLSECLIMPSSIIEHRTIIYFYA